MKAEQTVYFSVHKGDDPKVYDRMFETYKDKITIPERSKEADNYFYLQDGGVYFFLDDFSNPVDIVRQKVDDVLSMRASYMGYYIEFDCKCNSGNMWEIHKTMC